jgi:protein-disulfide isomerase
MRGRACGAQVRGRGRAARAAAGTAGAALMVRVLTGCNGDGSDSGAQGAASTAPAATTGTTATTGDGTSGSTAGAGTSAPPLSARQPPSRLEADGTTITVGNPAAPHTITLYEDPRCPICRQMEQVNGRRMIELALSGKVRLQYTMASFLDQNLGGGGSKRAVNALRAAVQENRFAPLHTVLYANQPDENEDGFTVDRLLELAAQVPGLRSPAFDAAVRGQTYKSFVGDSEKAFVDSGATGTPTVKMDGKTVSGGKGDIFTAAGFEGLLRQHGMA